MICDKCKKSVSIKDTSDWISLLCGCKILIYYKEGNISVIPKEDYRKDVVNKTKFSGDNNQGVV